MRWDCRDLVGVRVPDDPSHSQESLETLSAVAAHLCLLFLLTGGGRRDGGGEGDANSFWVSGFSPPFRNPPLFICAHAHTHTHKSNSVEDCCLCYGIWEAPLQLLPPVQTVTPAALGFDFPFFFPLPSLLSSPV